MNAPQMTPAQLKKARKLIRAECCNYDAQRGECFALDEGDGCVCVQAVSYSLLCRWFKEAVLPLEPELRIALEPKVTTRHCASCGKDYIPRGRASKYCPDCAKKIKRQRERERKRLARQKAGKM